MNKLLKNNQSKYFSHDSNAKDDPKCELLIEEIGLEGYGIFWILLEILREQENYKLPLSALKAKARKYNTTLEKMDKVVKNFGLFELEKIEGTDDYFFYSNRLNRNMELMNMEREAKSEAGKIGMRNRWQNDNTVITPLQENDNTVITPLEHTYNDDITTKVNQTKVNQTKGKQTITKEITNKEKTGADPGGSVSQGNILNGNNTQGEIDYVEDILNMFCEEYKKTRGSDYVQVNKDKDRKAVGKLSQVLREQNPLLSTDERAEFIKNYYRDALSIQDPFYYDKMSPSTATNEYNAIHTKIIKGVNVNNAVSKILNGKKGEIKND